MISKESAVIHISQNNRGMFGSFLWFGQCSYVCLYSDISDYLFVLIYQDYTGSVVVAQRLSCFEVCGFFRDQGSNSCLLH